MITKEQFMKSYAENDFGELRHKWYETAKALGFNNVYKGVDLGEEWYDREVLIINSLMELDTAHGLKFASLAYYPCSDLHKLTLEDFRMTPCEELGYKVGDTFFVRKSPTFDKGETITLIEDDGTNAPLFRVKTTNSVSWGDATYTNLSGLEKINNTLAIWDYKSPNDMTKEELKAFLCDRVDGVEMEFLYVDEWNESDPAQVFDYGEHLTYRVKREKSWTNTLDGTKENGVLCWCNDYGSQERRLGLIVEYCLGDAYCYRTFVEGLWRYATPLTKAEITTLLDNAPEDK